MPFTSSVRLRAARSTDFAGSSGKERVSEQLEMAANPLIVYSRKLPERENEISGLCIEAHGKKLWLGKEYSGSAERSWENNKIEQAVQ